MDKKCLVCDKMFFAKRTTAKFCSAKCRVAYSRDVNEDPQPAKVIKKPTSKVEDEWHNSAETKTQAEIEAHYTLKNFPRVKYGSGSGSYSPYPKSNPLSKAYLID